MAAQMKWQMGSEELTSPATLKAAFAETIAVMVFVFVGVGSIASFLASQGDGVPMISFAHGFAIALLTAGIGAISGGHINPAVTFAMVITNRVSVTRGGMYIVAQLIGAVLGALLLRAFISDAVLELIPGGGGQAVNETVVTKPLWGMFLEAIGTGVLVWTFFAVAVQPRGNSGVVAPLYIGFAILVIHLVLVPMTGSGINPARTFGPALALPDTVSEVPGRWSDWWIYYVGPLLGATAAALGYYFLYLAPEEEGAM